MNDEELFLEQLGQSLQVLYFAASLGKRHGGLDQTQLDLIYESAKKASDLFHRRRHEVILRSHHAKRLMPVS
jgi:hypothetical protein